VLGQLAARVLGRRGAVSHADVSIPWPILLSRAEQLKASHQDLAGRRVGLQPDSPAAALLALLVFSDMRCDAVLLPAHDGGVVVPTPTLHLDALVRVTSDLRTSVEYLGGGASTSVPAACVTVFSSGTTGAPHAHRWEWSTLWRRVRLSDAARGGDWVCAYPVDTFAGLQAVLYACAGADQLVFLRPQDTLSTARRWSTELRCAVGTPTFWRRTLLLDRADDLAAMRVHTISMGGEPATQDLLDALRATLAPARLVHVYASSEHGSIFSVSDGRAGFPAAWLGRRLGSGAALAVRDGELCISPRPGSDYLPIGDAVSVEGDRVHFDGRVDQIINVAGQKISLVQVESALRSVPGVADARAYAIASPVTGRVLAADLVIAGDESAEVVRDRVHAHFRQTLAAAARPRRIRFVDAVPVARSGKALRR
jgi:acyl-coenzyme A synthetase/AMP-(fatty) acid ligase